METEEPGRLQSMRLQRVRHNWVTNTFTFFTDDIIVVVQARVGKEFPDMRQNEREIKFITVGDAVRTMGQLKGEPMLNKGP